MEIRRWHYCVVINCALIIPYLSAKTFSLNEAIAAESRQKQELQNTLPPPESTGERFSLNKALSLDRPKSKKLKAAGSILPLGRKISPLKYRKSYQITSPLKPKKLKYKRNLRHKRRNQSVKREIGKDEMFDKKYIPLFRSIGMLFDNLLPPESSESTEIDRNKNRQTRYKSEERYGVCTCSRKTDSEIAESRSPEEAITSTTIVTELSTASETVTTEITTSATDNTSHGDVSSFGPHTDLPLLLTRDTSSTWGNNNGFSKGSSPAFYRSTEGYNTWDHRNSKHNTGCGQSRSSPTDNEKHPNGSARNCTSSNGPAVEVHRNGTGARTSIFGGAIDKSYEASEDENTTRYIGGGIDEYKRENKFETGRNKTASPVFLPEFVRGFRGNIPEDKVDNSTESLQPEEDCEQGDINVAFDNASDKRLAERNGTSTAEDQKASTTNEAVITIKDLSNPILLLQKSNKNRGPMVTIIDGYSVARDKTGKHKLTEKSIHVHSKN